MALTCFLPSPLGFISELLGKEPCYLSVNSWLFGPFAPPSFSTMLPGYSVGLTDFALFAFVSFIKAAWEVSI